MGHIGEFARDTVGNRLLMREVGLRVRKVGLLFPDTHQKNLNQSSCQVCTSHQPVGPIFVVVNCLLLIV